MIDKRKGFAVAIRRMEGKETGPVYSIGRGYYRNHLPNGGRVRILEGSSSYIYNVGEEMEVRVIASIVYSDVHGKNGYAAVYEILRVD